MNGELAMWHQSMQAAGRSPRTIDERLRIVAASGLDPQTCTVFDIESWLARPGLTNSTRRAYGDALRAFFGWMHRRGLRGDDPTLGLPVVKVPRGVPHPISTEQLRQLLATARTRRLRGYLLLGAYAGLRVSEIAAMDGSQIDGDWLTVTGKGGTVARLPLHYRLFDYAQDMPTDGWWFPSHGGHVTGKNVSVVVSDHMRAHGVAGTAHSLRHWFGSTLVKNGTQMRIVQDGLRHANLQTTQVYTQVTPAQLRQAIDGLPAA